MLILKNSRRVEKDEWMNLYNQFRKAIGLQNKHKGYFKEVFKKKIRSEDEKEPHTSMILPFSNIKFKMCIFHLKIKMIATNMFHAYYLYIAFTLHQNLLIFNTGS